jgi:glycosyltransferase involved in cell wall biosynthesis
MTRPRLSIVTPSYNQAKFIRASLESVSTQSLPRGDVTRCAAPVEHIIYDGLSTDETVGMVHSLIRENNWSHIKFTAERDTGQSEALNKGFAAATGDIIGWLNSDDLYLPGCFQTVLDFFEQHPDVDVLYGDYDFIDAQGELTQIRREISFSRLVLYYNHILYVPTTASFFRRRIFDDGYRLDTDLHYSMDKEFYLRLDRAGYKFQHISRRLAQFRFHDASKSTLNASASRADERKALLRHSKLLHKLRSEVLIRLTIFSLGLAARARRYAEKIVRGYYFSQWQTRRSSSARIRL